MENEKPKCTVRGSLRGGRAMCGYVIVGGEFCSLKPGECNLQDGAKPAAANGVQAEACGECGAIHATGANSLCDK